MDTIRFDKKTTKMVAHRGVSGLERENTNAAFIAAGNRSYFGVETDIHKTIDGYFVVIHDERTGRVAKEDMEVEKSTFEALRGIYLTDRGTGEERIDLRIPTLKEYINTCKRYEKIAVPELKNSYTEEDIANICKEIEECGYLENVIFISFNYDNLLKVRKLYPSQPVQFLTDDYDEELIERLKKDKIDLDIKYTGLSEEGVKAIKAEGIKINTFTVNDKETGERLASWGVDYITTNILE